MSTRQKARLIDISKCMGCRGCQVACKQWNGLPGEKTTFFAAKGGYQNPASLSSDTRVLVKFYEKQTEDGLTWRFRAHTCMHCTEAVCIEICPTEPKAMVRDQDTGFVYVNEERCIGCGVCEEACPFGVPHVDANKGVSTKCDGCIARIEEGMKPACAQTCPGEAITYGNLSALLAKANERISYLKTEGFTPHLYGESESGGLRTLFIMPEGLLFYDLPAKPKSKVDMSLFHHHLKDLAKKGIPINAKTVQEVLARNGIKKDMAKEVA